MGRIISGYGLVSDGSNNFDDVLENLEIARGKRIHEGKLKNVESLPNDHYDNNNKWIGKTMVAVNPEKNSSSKDICIALKYNSVTNNDFTSPKANQTARDNRFEAMTSN